MPKPIFIVGTGRSGTTLLRAILNAHPDLHLSKESSFLVVAKEKKYNRSSKAALERYFQSIPFGWLRLDRNDVLSRIPENASYVDSFRALLETDAARYGKTAWGDKTPTHWMKINSIREKFPDAVIINLVRDPRDVVASLLKVPFGSPSFVMNSIYTELALRHLRKQVDVHHLRLEDLLENPEQILRFILKQIDLPWDDHLLQHDRYSVNDVGGIPWLAKAYKPLQRKVSKRSLPQRQEAWVEWICRSAFVHFGYQKNKTRLSFKALISDLPPFFKSLIHVLKIYFFPCSDRDKEFERWHLHNLKAFDLYPEWDIGRIIEATFEE
ncbi:sulfotransferase [Mariniblastus sp.]|nr:sulfotransferase [Mariniblastus sp.]